jgi:hypothetical protein
MTSALTGWGLVLGIIGLGWMIYVALTVERPENRRLAAGLDGTLDNRETDERLRERRRAG